MIRTHRGYPLGSVFGGPYHEERIKKTRVVY